MFERDPKVSSAILRHSAESGDGKLRTVGAAKRVPVEAIKARQAPDRGDPKIAIVTLQNSKDAVVRQPMLARPPLPGIIMRQRRVLRKRGGRFVAPRGHSQTRAGQQQKRNARKTLWGHCHILYKGVKKTKHPSSGGARGRSKVGPHPA